MSETDSKLRQLAKQIESGQIEAAAWIRLTDKALTQAKLLAKEKGLPESEEPTLRLYLDGKGCDGFYYGIAFDPLLEDDLTFPHDGVQLIVDPNTFMFVSGSEVEWVDDERGQGFLVNNPNHKKFRGKFYKKKAWQDYLIEQATEQAAEQAAEQASDS